MPACFMALLRVPNDAPLVTTAHHNMAAFLAGLVESKFFENLDSLIARDSWQLRHEQAPQRW